MPELPEVETTKCGINKHINEQKITEVIIRNHQLRWPITKNLARAITNKKVLNLERRGKYILFRFDHGTLIAHLGMSGSMRIITNKEPPQKHDHVDIRFNNNKILRYNDPRRFGAILWTTEPYQNHTLLCKLGPEPLSRQFNANYLLKTAQNRKTNIKQLIMNSHVVVGVGNIYATESLFIAGIHPLRISSTISIDEARRIVSAIKSILRRSIKQGGTTLRDFVNSDGKPGYFKQQLLVYGRDQESCKKCKHALRLIRINNRATVCCDYCQS